MPARVLTIWSTKIMSSSWLGHPTPLLHTYARSQDVDVCELFSGVASIAKGFSDLPASEGRRLADDVDEEP